MFSFQCSVVGLESVLRLGLILAALEATKTNISFQKPTT